MATATAAVDLPSGARVRASGRAGDRKRIDTAFRLTPSASARRPPGIAAGVDVVGVDGKWYDVTAFADRHPGGDIIQEFVGKDATSFFHAWHAPRVLAARRPCGTYESPCADPAELDYRRLQQRATAEGWYETDMAWFARKVAVVAALFVAAVGLTVWGRTPFVRTTVGAAVLAAAWQQCGFFMHDFMHSQIFHDRKRDQALGSVAGTFLLGIGAMWWRDEHFEHHTFVNTYIPGVANTDPQMTEAIWAQDPALFQFFGKELPAWIQRATTSVQHLIFLPVVFVVGRFGICIDAMSSERRPLEWLAYAGHWAYMALLLSRLPTWWEVLRFYATISLIEGVLHLQLLLSHYDRPFADKETVSELSFFRRQAAATKDIENPPWLDWFHGGLNLHLAHHLLPRLPRHRLRMATSVVKQMCGKHGVEYDSAPWSHAVMGTLRHLHSVGHLVDAMQKRSFG